MRRGACRDADLGRAALLLPTFDMLEPAERRIDQLLMLGTEVFDTSLRRESSSRSLGIWRPYRAAPGALILKPSLIILMGRAQTKEASHTAGAAATTAL